LRAACAKTLLTAPLEPTSVEYWQLLQRLYEGSHLRVLLY
jgi:hypothetical protein